MRWAAAVGSVRPSYREYLPCNALDDWQTEVGDEPRRRNDAKCVSKESVSMGLVDNVRFFAQEYDRWR